MARPKKKAYEPKAFESLNQGKNFVNSHGKSQCDTTANLYESMLQSRAFKSLTAKQQILYVYCKAQYYGKRKPRKDYEKKGLYQDDTYFYFNWQLAIDYELYTEKSWSSLYHDMAILEKRGFIEKVKSGKGHKTKTVYKFSDKWQKY